MHKERKAGILLNLSIFLNSSIISRANRSEAYVGPNNLSVKGLVVPVDTMPEEQVTHALGN